MPFSIEDKHTFEVLRENNGYRAVHLLKMFPTKSWTLSGLKTLICKIDDCCSIKCCPGSSRLRTAHIAANIADVEDLVLSQDTDPQTHSSQREIAHQTGISRRLVQRIIHEDFVCNVWKDNRRVNSLKLTNVHDETLSQTVETVPSVIGQFYMVFRRENLYCSSAKKHSKWSRLCLKLTNV